jgi:lipopolysaccharide/colanic/teichoic acid biosynthesis glycosyltransferase
MLMRGQRGLDLAIGVPLLLITLPLIGVLMLLVRMDSRGHAVFKQARVGRAGKLFTLYKLRSFYEHTHGLFPGEEIDWRDSRITSMGRILRRSKLDELPQLVNVLLGHMSLVGPRPDIPIQVKRYSERDRQRLTVRPGLTGLAQISGNINLSWAQRIELDHWYIAHRSLRLDLAILLHTLPVVYRGERMHDDPLGIRRHVLDAYD